MAGFNLAWCRFQEVLDMRSTRLFAAFLAGLFFSTTTMAFDQGVLGDVEFVSQPSDTLLTHGQPEPHELVLVQRAGGKHVINLRGLDEFDDWDAGALVDALGMNYYHLPITDGQSLSRDRVALFDRILGDIGDEPVLVYCGSSNRVGAMFALRAAWLEGYSVDAAIELGREHGLTGLEARVRELLENGHD